MKIGRILDTTPDWDDPDPSNRLQALQIKAPPPELLTRLATCDPDARVRLAATGHLDDPATLAQLCTDAEQSIAEAAMQRWVQVVINGRPVDAARQRLDETNDPVLLASAASFAEAAELRLASINRIDDPSLLAAVLGRDNHGAVYRAGAARIEDEDTLDQLLKRFRGKDKNVARILRSRLDDIRRERRQESDLAEQCARLCASLEQLADGAHTDLFERRLAVLDEEWQDIDGDSVDAQLRVRIENARQQCFSVIEAQARERELLERAAHETVERLESLSAHLACGAETVDTLAGTLDALRSRWPVGFGEDHDLTRHYYELITPLENLAAQYALCLALPKDDAPINQLRAALGKITWPDGWPRPDRLVAAEAALQSRLDAQARHRVDEEREIARVDDQLRRLEQAITEGKLKPAGKLYNSLRKHIDGIAGRGQRETFANLSKQLHELQDWQGFVTVPKRTELCEQMEALGADTARHPAEKARIIKDLQDRWKALGPSNHRQSQQLWVRFKQAADAAFVPCAEYFATQRATREQNLAEREKICESLESLYGDTDWDKADWKAVNGLFVKARRAWRNHDDVPHARRKKIQGRFASITRQFEAKFAEEQARNHAIKQGLVDRLKELAAQPDTPVETLIGAAKQAQSEWKQVGITERKTDQRLWKAFREQCDAVFERRDAGSRREQETRNAASDAAQEVNLKLKRLMDSDEIDARQLRNIRSEFDGLAPKGDPVHKAFKQNLRLAEKTLHAQESALHRAMLNELRRKSNLCRALELGEMSTGEAAAAWASDIDIDPTLSAKLEQRRGLAGAADPATLAANLTSAELLCVRMEIMAELPSPPEAQAVRMQYQVDRLNRELSRGLKETRTPQQQVDDLLVEWYTLGPLPREADALCRRFHAAEEKLQSGDAGDGSGGQRDADPRAAEG